METERGFKFISEYDLGQEVYLVKENCILIDKVVVQGICFRKIKGKVEMEYQVYDEFFKRVYFIDDKAVRIFFSYDSAHDYIYEKVHESSSFQKALKKIVLPSQST